MPYLCFGKSGRRLRFARNELKQRVAPRLGDDLLAATANP